MSENRAEPSHDEEQRVTTAQILELVAMLRQWREASAELGRTGIATATVIRDLRLAIASTDGLLSRLKREIEELECKESGLDPMVARPSSAHHRTPG